MNEREYELATLINSLQYDITKLKEELESKYHEGYMDGKAFKDRHITIRDHFAGLAMQSLLTKASATVGSDSVAMAAKADSIAKAAKADSIEKASKKGGKKKKKF